jgi:hypothetical protein
MKTAFKKNAVGETILISFLTNKNKFQRKYTLEAFLEFPAPKNKSLCWKSLQNGN